ncbi:MAG: hypothetical protein M3Z35_14080 [Nitrospirota bacterium]|nr:hypothetical protein [Nitrospirota bacterium]
MSCRANAAIIRCSDSDSHDIRPYRGRYGEAALKEGAYDFIPKLLDRDGFILAIKPALEAHELRTSGPNHPVKGFMLCVLGLDPKVNVDDIKKLLLPYGTIAWARLIVNSNAHDVAIGYVESYRGKMPYGRCMR